MTYVSPDQSSFFITIFSLILVINTKHAIRIARLLSCSYLRCSASLFFSLTHSTSRSFTHFVFLSLSLSLSRSHRINLVKRKSRRCNNSVVDSKHLIITVVLFVAQEYHLCHHTNDVVVFVDQEPHQCQCYFCRT